MKRYKSVDEMIAEILENTKNVSYWFLDYIKRKRHPNEFPIYSYQRCCRIYLDEYKTKKEVDRMFNDEILKLAEDYYYFESDRIFENRWLRRK